MRSPTRATEQGSEQHSARHGCGPLCRSRNCRRSVPPSYDRSRSDFRCRPRPHLGQERFRTKRSGAGGPCGDVATPARWPALYRVSSGSGARHEVAIGQAAQFVRRARGGGELRVERRAADAGRLHDAGLRPRLHQQQRRDAGHARADHAAVPGPGLLRRHGARALARVGRTLAGPQARAVRDPQLAATGSGGAWTRGYRRTARHRAAANFPERARCARAVRCAVGHAVPAAHLPHASAARHRSDRRCGRADSTGHHDRPVHAGSIRERAALLADFDPHRREARSQRRGDRRHGYDECRDGTLEQEPRAAARGAGEAWAYFVHPRGSGTHAEAGSAGGHAGPRCLAGHRYAGVFRDHDRRHDPAWARPATDRTPDQRLARTRRRSRRMAATRRSRRGRTGGRARSIAGAARTHRGRASRILLRYRRAAP